MKGKANMNIADKIMTLEQAVAWHETLKAQGKKLVVTNGVFDLLHRGHAEYLSQAAAAGDALLVAINSDESVHVVKGPSRPVVCEYDRAYLLACCSFVDAVVIFSTKTATPLLSALKPEIYAKGGDYTVDTIVREEYEVMKHFVEKFVFIPFIKGHSTTETIRKMRGEESADAGGCQVGKLNSKLSLIYGRRSVRQYQLRVVDDNLIKDLLSAAMAAPSAGAKDPWNFIVLKTAESKKNVAALLKNGRFLADASVGIIVCGDIRKAHGGELSYLLQDCAAATENILLAARALSLGACWLGVHPREDRVAGIRRLFNLPDEMIPVSAVAIGWPAVDESPRTRVGDKLVLWM